MERWEKAQEWEKSWWKTCTNTYGEEEKQIVYARKMGLEFFNDGKTHYNIDMQDKTIIDFGGGPCSLLLKCVGFRTALVVDPLLMPQWVDKRYASANIFFLNEKAEEFECTPQYDEAWIYNVLQHVDNPQKVIIAARRAAKLIRLFDWLDTPPNVGHPQTLTEEKLNEWLGGYGKTEILVGRCSGRCYYGIFPT